MDVRQTGPRAESARHDAPSAAHGLFGAPDELEADLENQHEPEPAALAGGLPDAEAPPPLGCMAPGGGDAGDEPSFARLIGSATAVKLVMDTAVQIFNPFLSLIAVGLGTNITTMGRLISLRAIMGLFSPFFGVRATRVGYRRTIRISLLLAAAGIIIVGLSQSVWVAAVGMLLMGLGTGAFVPLIHAYLSGRLPYSRRARGLGIVEYSWALTGVIGLPLMGFLIAATSWRVPMVLIGVMLIGATFVIMRLPPSTPQGAHPGAHAGARPVERPGKTPGAPQPISIWQRVTTYFYLPGNVVSTWATIAAGALNYFAAMQVMIIYGTWLNQVYGLGPAALGTVAFVFGLFDLTASVAVSLFTDRLGKRTSVMLGASVAVIGYLAAGFLRPQMAGAIVLVALSRMGFEFAIVSYFPLLSEQQPAQRSKIMTLGSAIGLTFSTASGFTAPWLFTRFGMPGVVLVSGAATALAVLILFVLVREPEDGAPVLA
jgi:predicted MFS family arabinose efflux permease